jgi:UDP-N-acetylmuramoyl-L-alanyl-D-glutamate--2,6-diaminopimelate ligase
MADRTSPVAGISLRELLPGAEIVGADDIRVERCCIDSRQCRPGDLFVAIPGSRADGHDFALQAVQAGAEAVLLNRPVAGLKVPVCCVDDVADAFGRLCQALAGEPGRSLKIIGITGTNGKTTTSHLTASVLNAAGYPTGLLGTLGYDDGMEIVPARWTTPPAHVLAPWLARIAGNGCTHAVMEVSSHALSQCRVAGVDFDAVCVTNVRHDHLDYHATARNYSEAKARIFDHLLPEGFAVLNADDDLCPSYLERIDGPVLTVGIDSAAEITATPVEQFISEQTFLLSIGNETAVVRTPLIGRHNIYNCLQAAAVGFTYGIELTTIVRGLEAVSKVPGRLERIECGQTFGVFVDYAHTADALVNVLATLREVTSGRLICVFGAGGDRDQSKRPKMGRAVESSADLAIITSDNPRGEHPARIAEAILQGFERPTSAEVVLDRRSAIHRALASAQKGDCVLIAGKGHEDYQIVGDKTFAFDDREVARQWLYGFAASDRLYRASA